MYIPMYTTNGPVQCLRFEYYGDFDTMKWIVGDCSEEMTYIGNSSLDGAPIFTYTFDKFDYATLMDFKKLNVYLRELKIRSYTTKDLSKKERSLLTFFTFFMNSDENRLIKGVNGGEIRELRKDDS